MIKVITKIGNSKGIILDSALLELAHLKEGDQLSVTIHDSGGITFTPTEPRSADDESFSRATGEVLEEYKDTLKKLS